MCNPTVLSFRVKRSSKNSYITFRAFLNLYTSCPVDNGYLFVTTAVRKQQFTQFSS